MFPFTIVFRLLEWVIEAINIHDIQTISFEHVKGICVILLKKRYLICPFIRLSVKTERERGGCKLVSNKIILYLRLTGTGQYHTNDIVILDWTRK